MKLAIATLAVGALLGLILGVPLGRRVERVAWFADATAARARVTGWLIRDVARLALTAVVVAAVAVFTIWALAR